MNELAEGDIVECCGFLWTVMGCSVRSTQKLRIYKLVRWVGFKMITRHANITELQVRR